jgi:hypothetical protein
MPTNLRSGNQDGEMEMKLHWHIKGEHHQNTLVRCSVNADQHQQWQSRPRNGIETTSANNE